MKNKREIKEEIKRLESLRNTFAINDIKNRSWVSGEINKLVWVLDEQN